MIPIPSEYFKFCVVLCTFLLFASNFHPSSSQYTIVKQAKNSFENAQQLADNSSATNGASSARPEIVLLLLMSTQTELPVYFELVKPTLDLAVEYVNSHYSEFKIRVRSRKDAKSCADNQVGAMAAEEYYTRQLDGIIGPICSKALQGAARLASHWGVPIITAGGIGVEFSNKRAYRSLTRIALSLGKTLFFNFSIHIST